MPDSFTYNQFRVDDDRRTVHFDYTLTHDQQVYQFSEALVFPVGLQDTPTQHASLRALHLALGVSYYKIFTPATVSHPYQMDEQEASFWNDVWRNGLGEFLYVNKLSPDVLATFTPQDGQAYAATDITPKDKNALLGIGGGKDSIVAGESLKKIGVTVQGFVMATGEQRGQAQAVADTMQIPLHVVERTLDKQLLTVQELPGAHKGHVPISLIFGLVGTALAVALDAGYVVVANESSASLPRVMSEHGAVNHQWSKSFGFEHSLQTYVHNRIASGITYFSAVRQLTSVAVAKLFAWYPQYFEVFTSDNAVFRIDPSKRPNARWSLDSPKSLSSFILLAPWLTEEDLLRAFGRNFLDEAELENLFLSLLGVQGEQPLDCVGTVDELMFSLNLAVQEAKFLQSSLVRLAFDMGIVTNKDTSVERRNMLRLQPEAAIPPELQQPLAELFTKDLA